MHVLFGGYLCYIGICSTIENNTDLQECQVCMGTFLDPFLVKLR